MRTYMMICLGGALSVLITLYEIRMLQTVWSAAAESAGLKFDASRLASQAIAGIGFLASGMILKRSHQQVKGQTTASGLFAAVCLSLAAGAGFAECVLTVLALIVLVLNDMAPLEAALKRRAGNHTLIVEMDAATDIAAVIEAMEELNVRVHDTDLEREGSPAEAVVALKLADGGSSPELLCRIARLECVRFVEERM